MTTPFTTTPSTAATLKAAAGRLAAFAIGMAERVARIARHRREAARLLDLDDRLLADIGVSRDTVRAALIGSFLTDPSDRLNAERQTRARRFYDKAGQGR